jgi:hypothetical protein
MTSLLSDLFEWLIDSSSYTWPVRLILSIVVFGILLFMFGDDF